jgi:hypothetical protein
MPPGPLYNWLAVAHSALVILDHALQYRAAQVTRVGSIRLSQSRQRGARGGVYEKTQEEVKDVEEIVPSTADEPLSSEPTHVQPSSLLHANEAWLRQLEIAATPRTSLSEMVARAAPSRRYDCSIDATRAELFLNDRSRNRRDSTSCSRAPRCLLPTSTSLVQIHLRPST